MKDTNVFKKKGTIKNTVIAVVVGALVFSVASGSLRTAKYNATEKEFKAASNQIELEAGDVSSKIDEIKAYELEQHTTLGTITRDKNGTVFNRLQKVNKSNLFDDSEYVSNTLENGGTMTRFQYDDFISDSERIQRNIDNLTEYANYDTSGISEKISDVSSKNSENNKAISNEIGNVSSSLKESDDKLEKSLKQASSNVQENTSEALKQTSNTLKSSQSSLNSDLTSGVENFYKASNTQTNELYQALLTALSEDNDDAYAALMEWYESNSYHLMLLKSEVAHAKKQVASNLSARNWIIGNADGGYVNACQAAGHLTFGDLASALSQANLTSYVIPTSSSNIEYKKHYHTFGTNSNGDPIYQSDIEAYCDDHGIAYGFGSDMTFYCGAKSPSEIVEAMGGDPSSSCYAGAGHTHSSTSAGGSDNNVKYSGHHCTWENYTYSSTCGGSSRCSGKGDSWCPSCQNNGGGYTLTCTKCGNSWHSHATSGSCPKGTTKTGQRYTCGSPTNTYKPTRCGYSDGEPVQARYTVGNPSEDLGSGETEEITH